MRDIDIFRFKNESYKDFRYRQERAQEESIRNSENGITKDDYYDDGYEEYMKYRIEE